MKLIDKLARQVAALQLNLRGKVVLTEAATGPYVVTPVLAALAGAKVYAYTRTTRYGTAEQVIAQTRAMYEPQRSLDITFTEELSPEMIAAADLVTNSGHLRPLNQEKLQYASDRLAIALMYEAWEWREADMDLSYLRERGFRIGATNERHPAIDVFNYLGEMAVRQIHDAGLSLYQNTFVLVCNNDFGPYIASTLSRLCRQLGVIDKPENKHRYALQENVAWLGNFPALDIPEAYQDAEGIIFTAYPFDHCWIGQHAEIGVRTLKKKFRDPLLLRYAGDVDTQALGEAGIRYFPAHVPGGHMGILPSAIGEDPIIRLQAGGLKAGEALMSGEHLYQQLPIVDLI